MIGRAPRIASMAEQESGTAAAEPVKAATLSESEWREREGERDWILENGDPYPIL